MPYALSNSRNLQIANSITNAANKDDKGPEVNALTELLKIDTKQSNADFLIQFRELKNTHPFVNDLCQRRGFLGSITYAFRWDDYRAERYKAIIDQLKKAIIDQLKQCSYIDQDHNNKISYFGTAANLKKSVCEKVEEIKNGYLAKTYTSTEDQSYKKDKKVFEELKNFNENVGFKPSKAISTDIQTKDDNDMFIWNEFVKANPEYSSLSPNNQDNVEFNINGTSVQDLKQEVLKKLNLPENTKLFTEEGNLDESVGKAIKQLQAVTKIQAASSGMLARRTSKVPIRDNPLKFENQPIAKGNHASAYKQAGFVVKDLHEPNEIIKVKYGISIMTELAKENNLKQHHLVEEKIIYENSNSTHLQYTAIRMTGEAIQISDSSKKMTKKFANDASKAISFLNKNNIIYGNIKPENFLYKKTNDKVSFYLQDYGAIDKYSKDKNTKWGSNGYINKYLYSQPYIAKLDPTCSDIQLIKSRNLSGLIFTIYDFHNKGDDTKWELLMKDPNTMTELLNTLDIVSKKDQDLIRKLCFGDIPLTIQELSQVEQIINNI